VWRTRVGYAGGTASNPTYTHIGDHTECFQVDFDPTVVSYEDLLELALTAHDPFRSASKGQYASLVLTHSDAQLATARAVADRFEALRDRTLATRIEPIKRFTDAEDYHQKYYLRNDRTLMADFRAMFASDDAFRESTAAARVNGYVAGDGSRLRLERDIDDFGLTPEAARHLAEKAARSSWRGGCSL
jgi:methionine-S-sulfoxide reductase